MNSPKYLEKATAIFIFIFGFGWLIALNQAFNHIIDKISQSFRHIITAT